MRAMPGRKRTGERKGEVKVATKEEVYEVLQTCYDPEIPVNIVDLGLIYDVDVKDETVKVKMTLTAPGCGMGSIIATEARQKILELPGVIDANVELVWDPPWHPGLISEEAKHKLGIA
jgi:metal-sulfur cluster biosynthetic enzyme